MSAELVDSLNHPLALRIRQLLSRSEHQDSDAILIDDCENILEAIRAGVELETVFYAGEDQVSEALDQALPPALPRHEVARRTSKKLFDNAKMSRVFAIARRPQAIEIDALAATRRDIVALEDVSIAGNVGAIIRTALAFAAAGLVLLDPAFDVFDRRVIRASRGHVFTLPIVTATSEQLLAFCKRHERRLVLTTPRAETTLTAFAEVTGPSVLAFGGEKRGCSPALAAAADLEVRIPMDPRVESLNVSVAASVSLYSRFGHNHRTSS